MPRGAIRVRSLPHRSASYEDDADYRGADKTDYSAKDLARWAREFNIPWKLGYPANYPLTRTSDATINLLESVA